MDELDRASQLETTYRENMINHLREEEKVISSSVCVDCGEPIPLMRRLAVRGCFRCVDCQEIAERKNDLGIGV